MTFPAFLYGSVISILIASLFHLIVDGNIKRYLSYLLFSWLGFWIGHYVSQRIRFTIWRSGILDIGICAITSILLLLLIYWINKGEEDDENSKEER